MVAWWWILVTILISGAGGLIVTALLVAARDSDREAPPAGVETAGDSELTAEEMLYLSLMHGAQL